ncbi:MAG: LytTR family transcriptional regulator DNA-binding domain-containing protein [Aequorivita sp.]|nr:LytTR family transcriptional regulator DNA-binding domain-containing protein [Aequorivita sp.]
MKRRSAIIIVLLLVMAIAFETFQQLFYIKRFDLAQGVSFFYILKNQAYRWIIWMLFGFFLMKYVKKKAFVKNYTFGFFIKYIGFIIALVAVIIVIISCIQLYFDAELFSINILLSNYIPFYIFQKAPIFTLGYIAIAIILHFYFLNEKLQIQVQTLSELKDNNLELYDKLKAEINDKTTILNIKIGNKRKIIPIQEIIWIEADDYCAKVHLTNGKSYSMRSTLKALEEKLQKPFLRVHRKAIVNMDTAKELNTSEAPFLNLNNNIQVPVSKKNLKTVREFIS